MSKTDIDQNNPLNDELAYSKDDDATSKAGLVMVNVCLKV